MEDNAKADPTLETHPETETAFHPADFREMKNRTRRMFSQTIFRFVIDP